MKSHNDIAAVVIGRNEGDRLRACLNSLVGQVPIVVYVDSGSTDGSVAFAKSVGATVVELDMSIPFTAARARNAGFWKVLDVGGCDYVQFVDGDCTLQPGWLEAGREKMLESRDIAVVYGRTRERHPDASIYNRLCDMEWDTPVGETKSCGGIALMRTDAVKDVDGFNAALIAGEEPELCVRMRKKGWRMFRIGAEMALHDAALTRFSQYWKRTTRGGFAAAEGAAMHGAAPVYHCVVRVIRALVWGVAIPVFIALLTILISPWAMLMTLLYPVQVIRMAVRARNSKGRFQNALLLTIGKFAEAQGIFKYWWRRLTRGDVRLIEYK
ncbi:glycosyltransferase family 2 protein [Hwanghaeella sp.]|uniref:glycosyltransferase family 2 protein n=1 Tax=Hwanghaeella sp. TaxID=2605943 RepID=UPI003CCBF6F9